MPASAPQSSNLPQLIIIGAQKSGTTALAAYLGQHPRLLHPTVKEIDFFGSNPRYVRGLDWYATQWPKPKRSVVGRLASLVRRQPMRFDASPHYMRCQHAADRIHQHLPAAKLIAVLRDPVERAYSAWKMYRKQMAGDAKFYETWNQRVYSPGEIAAFEPRTPAELQDFELAIRREADCLARGKSMLWSVLEYGLYGPQLGRYLQFFPREQLLVLDNRDLLNRSAETLNRVLAFLGLPSWDWSRIDLSPVFSSGESSPVPPRVQDFLSEFYMASNRQLARIVDPLPDWAQTTRRAAA